MLSDYFGGFADGRLRSIPFLIRWILLVLVFLGVLIGLGAAIGITERLVGGDIQALQKELAQRFGPLVAIGLLGFAALIAIAFLKIVAKRARDVGLPGWLSAIVIAGLAGGATQMGGPTTSGGLGFVLILILAFLPTDMLRST